MHAFLKISKLMAVCLLTFGGLAMAASRAEAHDYGYRPYCPPAYRTYSNYSPSYRPYYRVYTPSYSRPTYNVYRYSAPRTYSYGYRY